MVTSDLLEKAIVFAVNAHKGVKRKGDKRPYIMHPMSVMWRISNNKESSNMYLLAAAAILHDTVEDVDWVSHELIYQEFGPAVAALVEELTLDKAQYEVIGKKEYLLQEMNKMSSYGLAIKLCDRLDNVCDLRTMNLKFRKRYVEETEYILEKLDRKLTPTHKRLIRQIWDELNKIRKTFEVSEESVILNQPQTDK
jgi:(p)ppGpp synthase/HD superfamily hydrolase